VTGEQGLDGRDGQPDDEDQDPREDRGAAELGADDLEIFPRGETHRRGARRRR
jgi:hypothetical protein